MAKLKSRPVPIGNLHSQISVAQSAQDCKFANQKNFWGSREVYCLLANRTFRIVVALLPCISCHSSTDQTSNRPNSSQLFVAWNECHRTEQRVELTPSHLARRKIVRFVQCNRQHFVGPSEFLSRFAFRLAAIDLCRVYHQPVLIVQHPDATPL